MCKVNFVDEHNCFMRYARNNLLTGRERLLWLALFTIANDRAIYNANTRSYEWPDGFFPVTNSELSSHSTLDKRGIESIRNRLKQRGLIDFEKGERNAKAPMYKINYLSLNVGYKFVPNDAPNVPPNDMSNVPPNSDANDPPIIIDINSIQNGERENNNIAADDLCAGAESALDDYLHFAGLKIDEYIGVDDRVKQVVERVTAQLFMSLGGRPANNMDAAYVFAETRTFNGSQWVNLNADRVRLLAYSFEQANRKGCPGSWQYISGVMRKLDQRGIKTIYDIEDYDNSRCG